LRVLDNEGAIFVGEFAAQLGGNACPEGTGRNDGMLGDDGAGGDNAAFTDAAIVKDSRAHADDTVVAHDTAVDGGIVADRDPIADGDGIEVALAMKHGAILDVGAGADANEVDVAAQDGVHPDRGALAEDDIANDLRRNVNVAIAGDLGCAALIGANH